MVCLICAFLIAEESISPIISPTCNVFIPIVDVDESVSEKPNSMYFSSVTILLIMYFEFA